ncbi:MAG: hypothetical protein JW867_00185 [Candidatus Omnitrophica bacterium]|nr:hypothetical protein [Candidatus Omnitrophota bacterium]
MDEKAANTRVTCLNCMDGRVQLPVLNWIRKQYKIDHVDVITEAGMDGVLASQENIDDIKRSIKISINKNKSNRIFIVGHHDCKGNSVDKKTHQKHIAKSVERLKKYWPKLEIIGLWVNDQWQVEVCFK